MLKAWLCNKKYWLGIIIGLVIIIMILFLLLFIPKLKLNGHEEITLEYGEKYKEEGAYVANFFYKKNNHIKIKEHINYQKLGNYQVDYYAKYFFFQLENHRKIHIVDRKKPEITLKGNDTAIVCPNQKYQEEGYQALDNYDKDITSKVIREEQNSKIIYRVKDSSNNQDEKIRNIKYEDSTPPTLTLNGKTNLTLYVNQAYQEAGARAFDNCEGDISSQIVRTGSVNTNAPGIYYIVYTVKDSSQHEVKQTRTVRVIPRSNNRDKTIYLTFDDGPSASITPGILRILKEENVKATFFVINHSDSLNYLIQQAYHDGHTIALHSNSHNYQYIYSSIDNYFNDLQLIENKVKLLTGQKSSIIRFPGGSSNTVSRRYCPGIMSYLVQEVQNRGYQYFDWNVDSEDAGGARTSLQVYQNVTSHLTNKSNVVLMHDFEGNQKTLNALRDIIRYGKENGYQFDKLQIDSFPAHHGVNN